MVLFGEFCYGQVTLIVKDETWFCLFMVNSHFLLKILNSGFCFLEHQNWNHVDSSTMWKRYFYLSKSEKIFENFYVSNTITSDMDERMNMLSKMWAALKLFKQLFKTRKNEKAIQLSQSHCVLETRKKSERAKSLFWRWRK